MTPPAQFTLDSSYSSGDNIIPGYWNSSSDSIFLSLLLPSDDQSLVGGRLQPRVNFGNTDYVDLGDPIAITNIPTDGPITLGIDESTHLNLFRNILKILM